MHYLKLLGDPSKVTYFEAISKANPPKSIHPYSLMLMASRLGLKITNDYADLSWIPYIVLATKLPSDFEKNINTTASKEKVIQRLCYLKAGDHPGDKYFKELINHYILRRSIILKGLTEENRKKFFKSHSWVKFRYESSNTYFLNMTTKEKVDFLPSTVKILLNRFCQIEKKLIKGFEVPEGEVAETLSKELNNVIQEMGEISERDNDKNTPRHQSTKGMLSPVSDHNTSKPLNFPA